MGTRSLTFVYSDGSVVMNMYRQFDGYPTGHGAELAEFLGSFDAIVNGYAFNESRKVANGMGCLAAQLVANFKVGVGGFYLYPADATDCGQEYEYHVYENVVKVKDTDGFIFIGSWTEFKDWCKEPVDA
jgi:hypothetical protein